MQNAVYVMTQSWRPRPLQPLESLVDRAHRALLDAICEGRLAPGERLTQERLGDLLGVSRQPISQALALLKQQGFVRDAGGRGLEVAPVDPDHLRSVFEVRAALEGLAAAAAAKQVAAAPDRLAGPLAELDGIVAAGQEAVRQADVAALVRCDIAFHGLVADLSGNPVVVEITRQQWDHIRRGITVALEDPGFHRRCWQEHAAMAAAIGSGDADGAAAVARRHCEIAATETWQRLTRQAGGEPA